MQEERTLSFDPYIRTLIDEVAKRKQTSADALVAEWVLERLLTERKSCGTEAKPRVAGRFVAKVSTEDDTADYKVTKLKPTGPKKKPVKKKPRRRAQVKSASPKK